ncbi:hypothetical protein J437_LFUL017014 [Ladona fulva]|uniref:Uncharacterized protein n=1 Tax=Ladona fulva TaxID=123851 RepID=A0A8K0KLM1_LADFU|nr:hypothetical protein J437_LFUL017014 [Ladona fulva]
MNDLQLQIGPHCNQFAETYDVHCVRRQERRSHESTQEARKARKTDQAALLKDFEEEEDLFYGPDTAD